MPGLIDIPDLAFAPAATLPKNLSRPHLLYRRVPPGLDGWLLVQLAQKSASESGSPIFALARDEARKAQILAACRWFGGDLSQGNPNAPLVIDFPAWDCLPYDRASPSSDLRAARLDALRQLATSGQSRQPTIMVTTLDAALQRVIAKTQLQPEMRLTVGQSLSQKTLITELERGLYRRTAQVREAGEYAVRGGIVDFFPTGRDHPYRLDFFGDVIETIKPFDAMTQVSFAPDHAADALILGTASEITLDEAAISRFRVKYRALFGVDNERNPLYQAISEGRPHVGMEHFLPLFYDNLVTIFDYAPAAPLVMDYEADQAAAARFEQIDDYYTARRDFRQKRQDKSGAVTALEQESVYHPLPPTMLYLGRSEWDGLVRQRQKLDLSPDLGELPDFAPQPPKEASPHDAVTILDLAAQPIRDFAAIRQDPKLDLFAAILNYAAELQRAGKTLVIAADSEGSRDVILARMRDKQQQLRERGQPAEARGEPGREPGVDPGGEPEREPGSEPDALPYFAAELLLVNHWAELENFAAESQPPQPLVKPIILTHFALPRGFMVGSLAVLSETDIFGEHGRYASAKKRRRAADFLTDLTSLSPQDLVVHVDHGIGRYDGLETLQIGNAPHDCLRLIYAGDDKLYVPVENIDMISRFGGEDAAAALDKLGSAAWQSRKARVKKRLRDLAAKLMEIAAKRALMVAEPIVAPPGIYDDFVARFPWVETIDQQRAIEDVLDDLASGRVTDRLICGDVGFGKTEIALRAALVTVMAGFQVAIAVPTTLLARQHYNNFVNRFKGLPVKIGNLSRLVAAKDAAITRAGLADGTIDIVVGTHALMAQSIKFNRLGLVVVDEEQHFGVAQKEKLKELAHNVHLLTLTATPIPRTLHLAMAGVRDMSLIATPPIDRLAVKTFVMAWDAVTIREAILREKFRGGQVFYVCPRIEDLDEVSSRLRQLVPEVTMRVAHGKLAARDIENIMSDFCDAKFDVLLSTPIVESGLDIPTANTMIIHRADRFGLSQLYQLRGRVGRAKQRGYAFLTTPDPQFLPISAQKRLEVMLTLDQLGAGFQLASHDLDLRGAGNLLGEEQSGHIKEVGIELYQQLLEEAMQATGGGGGAAAAGSKEGSLESDWSPQLTVGMPILIPENYVADLSLRLGLYRRLGSLQTTDEIDGFAVEMVDRFGALPPEFANLLRIIGLKSLCKQANIAKIDAGPKGAVVAFHNPAAINLERLLDVVRQNPLAMKLRPDSKVSYLANWDSASARLAGVEDLAKMLAAVTAQAG
ncbi:MAG: transcription-repair coupling factor [Candidatus Symbiobacter sp.]|nr:transcription-repair coupling factor [Candidatus Symbiobacter sp.]